MARNQGLEVPARSRRAATDGQKVQSDGDFPDVESHPRKLWFADFVASTVVSMTFVVGVGRIRSLKRGPPGVTFVGWCALDTVNVDMVSYRYEHFTNSQIYSRLL
jgi:hypothetical protein